MLFLAPLSDTLIAKWVAACKHRLYFIKETNATQIEILIFFRLFMLVVGSYQIFEFLIDWCEGSKDLVYIPGLLQKVSCVDLFMDLGCFEIRDLNHRSALHPLEKTFSKWVGQ